MAVKFYNIGAWLLTALLLKKRKKNLKSTNESVKAYSAFLQNLIVVDARTIKLQRL
jgi:hypothetical protein